MFLFGFRENRVTRISGRGIWFGNMLDCCSVSEAASEGLEEAKRLFYRDGSNKENFNVEKAEALKLSVEPQQMKRKKKGGGYNLRKSLAWDRAFFTEEGIFLKIQKVFSLFVF